VGGVMYSSLDENLPFGRQRRWHARSQRPR
jgi:hypothetical protein